MQLEFFYNTVNLEDNELKEARTRIGTQNELILKLFRANPGISYSPCEVHKLMGYWNTPLTSVRRALTTLTNEGYLIMTDELREGWYGMKNHCWKLK